MHRHPLVAAFDLVVCLALMFVILALTSSHQPPHIPTYGQFAITTAWPSNSDDDVDLYVRDPMGSICFFGNTNVANMHLEHDDLGTQLSGTVTLLDGRKIVTSYNGERTILTSVTPGEYTVNIHLYRKKSLSSVPVTVQLWSLRGNDAVLLTRKVILRGEGDEQTVWRFTLSESGHVSNVNERYTELVFKSRFANTASVPIFPGTGRQ